MFRFYHLFIFNSKLGGRGVNKLFYTTKIFYIERKEMTLAIAAKKLFKGTGNEVR